MDNTEKRLREALTALVRKWEQPLTDPNPGHDWGNGWDAGQDSAAKDVRQLLTECEGEEV
jgi:hypothetical protein